VCAVSCCACAIESSSLAFKLLCILAPTLWRNRFPSELEGNGTRIGGGDSGKEEERGRRGAEVGLSVERKVTEQSI
jgi:hypothetical protein